MSNVLVPEILLFNADDLAARGWTDITQVASQTPNLDIKYVWGNSMPVGVSTTCLIQGHSVNLERWLVTCRAMASLLVLAVSMVVPS